MKHSCLMVSMGVLLVAGCQVLIQKTFDERLAEAKSAQHALLAKYVADKKFGQPLPRLDGAALRKIVGDQLTPEESSRVKKELDRELEYAKTQMIYPQWVEYRRTQIAEAVNQLVTEANASAKTNGFEISRNCFEKAREACWQGAVLNVSLDGAIVPEVALPLRKAVTEILDAQIGVAQWPIVEREMRGMAKTAIRTAKFDKGIQELKAYAPIRAYTVVLDGKVSALMDELVRLGVPKNATRDIAVKTEAWMRKYENLSDTDDKTVTEKRTVGKPVVAKDESAYRRLLKEYEAALLLYDCTDENTRAIITQLAGVVTKMLEARPKPEQPRTETYERLARLGATALNLRIAKLQGALIAELEKAREESRKVAEELARLKKADAAAARDKAIDLLTASGTSAGVRSEAMEKLLTEINPALWAKIEREIREKVEEFVRAGACNEGVKWLADYKYIRTYGAEIDRKFAEVASAAAAFGVPSEKASAITAAVAATAAEMERLADWTDEIVDKVTPGRRVPANQLARFDAALLECGKTLQSNGLTKENTEAVLDSLRKRFAEERAILERDIHKGVFYLGSNALNRRLKALKERCAGELIGRVASNLVAEKNFGGARSKIRDIDLTGQPDFDAKVYAMRVGVLDTIVNPVQLESEKTALTGEIGKFCEKGDYRALRDWINSYAYIHDSYPDLIKSMSAVSGVMQNLKVTVPDPDQYADKILQKVAATVEKAKSDYVMPEPKPDFAELERMLALFDKAYLTQYYKKAEVAVTRDRIREDIKLFLDRQKASLSTEEVNKALRAHIETDVRARVVEEAARRKPRYRLADDQIQAEAVKTVVLNAAKAGFVAMAAGKEKDDIYTAIAGEVSLPVLDWLCKLFNELNAPKTDVGVKDAVTLDFDTLLDTLVRRQEYLEFLAAMDKEINYDSQIAMSEDAIDKQLTLIESGSVGLQVNAMLGEYARSMRLLKRQQVLSKDQGAVLVFGAVYLDQPAVFARALELGADVNAVGARDPLQRTALLLAVQLGRTAFVHRLVDAGAQVKVTDVNGDTPVHYAARRGSIALLEAMIKGNDVNAVNKAGETALFISARNNEPALVKTLIDAGVSVAAANLIGQTAFDAACEAGSRDVLDALADAGAAYGPDQLKLAAANGRLAVAQWLVARGVDVDAPGVVEASAASPVVRRFLLSQGAVAASVPSIPVAVPAATEPAAEKGAKAL